MRTIRVAFLLVVFLASLFVGYQAGQSIELNKTGSELNPLAYTLMPSPPPVAYANGQRSVLMITVNRFDESKPRLESAWLVLVVPPDPRLTLMPVYPSLQDPEGSEKLAEAFKLEKLGDEQRLGTEFLQLMRDQEIWWSDTAVFDRVGLEILLAYLDSRGQTFDPGRAAPLSASILDDMDGAETMKDRLVLQTSLFEEICWQAGQFDVRPGLSSLFGNLDGHVIASARPDQTIAALRALELSAGGLYCEFPTRRDW
jgi:hypothetical protein